MTLPETLHPSSGDDDVADDGLRRSSGCSATACCRWRRFRASISRPSSSRPSCRAPAPRPWRPRWRRRWRGSSPPSPASIRWSRPSGQGVTTITMQFDLDRNIDGAALDVQSAMTTAAKQLPIADDHAAVLPEGQPGRPAGDLPRPRLRHACRFPCVDEYAETMMAERISTLPGVAQVNVFGAQKFAVRVQANPEALAAKGLTLDDVQNAVAAANSDTPVGTLMGPGQSFTLQVNEPASARRRFQADHRRLPQRRAGAAPATSRPWSTASRTTRWRAGTTASARSSSRVQRQPDANTVAGGGQHPGAPAGVRGRAARRGEARRS